ncbi:MAG: hypothetical protein ACOY4R_27495 [Pseudomonadota bacterium]
MERAKEVDTRKRSGVRNVSSVAAITTHTINETFADLLRPFSAKEIARRLRLPSARTVENWKAGTTAPQAKHLYAMLTDAELCALLLKDVGQPEAAKMVLIEAARKRVRELEGG